VSSSSLSSHSFPSNSSSDSSSVSVSDSSQSSDSTSSYSSDSSSFSSSRDCCCPCVFVWDGESWLGGDALDPCVEFGSFAPRCACEPVSFPGSFPGQTYEPCGAT
jgi:hypothetical protein